MSYVRTLVWKKVCAERIGMICKKGSIQENRLGSVPPVMGLKDSLPINLEIWVGAHCGGGVV